MDYTLFLDTSALISLQNKAFEENFIISQITLQEIEDIKTSKSKDGEVKYKARQMSKLLDSNENRYKVVKFDTNFVLYLDSKHLPTTHDNIIVASAYYYQELNQTPVLFVTDDINLRFIANKVFNLRTKHSNNLRLVDGEEYMGYKEIVMDDDEMAYFYSHLNENIYNLAVNEYLVIKDKEENIVENRCWTGTEHRILKYKQVSNDFIGKIKPRNNEQMLAFDMLQDKRSTIKVLTGPMGSGKDFLQIANALRLIKLGEYDKIVYLRNPIGVKDIKEIGFLPGDLESKLKPFALAIADHLGGETGLDMQMMQGNICVEHLGHIRGRTYNNCILYLSEAENLSKEHMKLIISRVGEGSTLWINGDYAQVDSPIFRLSNGLCSTISCLTGQDAFGFVKLRKTERSKTAELAELL